MPQTPQGSRNDGIGQPAGALIGQRLMALTARDAYRLWAPIYERETAVSFLEDVTVAELEVPVQGRALLDAGCGTGRRLRNCGAASVVGIDLCPEMLGRASDRSGLAAADLNALPFADESFDVVWCRLAIGHVRDLGAAYTELARVCRLGGSVVVSDLNPHLGAAGHHRSFHDGDGAAHLVDHVVHSIGDHAGAAARSGLQLVARRDGVVAPNIRQFYVDAGRLRAYREQLGTSIVVALSWRKIA